MVIVFSHKRESNMANKYDLLLVNTEGDGKKRPKLWYKERLQTKYIKPLKQRGVSETLVGRDWTFLERGLDDFRDGLPPEVNYNYVKKGHDGFGPHITRSDEQIVANAPKKFTKHESIYSKVIPLQQQRRDHVENIEYNLTQHPLALFPHLEESLPADVFEDVVEVLDHEMNIDSETEGDEEIQENQSESKDSEMAKQPSLSTEAKESSQVPVGSDKHSISEEVEKDMKPTYKWLPRQEDVQKEEKSKASRKKAESLNSDTKIQEVTREFCDWVAGLGGESNNIEEQTVMSLFASGYETKPALSVPIHVVELTNVPPELRMATASTSTKPSESYLLQTAASKSEDKTKYIPSWVKVKYGAWYLNPKSWKARPYDDPLQDPKEQQDKSLSDAKKKSQKLDAVLASMHGARAFKDFIDKKNTRTPEFLAAVAEQNQQASKPEEDGGAKIERKQRTLTNATVESTAS